MNLTNQSRNLPSKTRGERSLVEIAELGRLVRTNRQGTTRLTLGPVDVSALTILELALSKRCPVSFVYPAPSAESATLLAAQLLLHRFARGELTPSLGLLTADSAGASRTWEELGLSTVGAMSKLGDVFPVYRAEPDGATPFGYRKCPKGVVIGSRFDAWKVDMLVVDHTAGPVFGEPEQCTVRVFADPSEPRLRELASKSEVIWGWSPGVVRAMLARLPRLSSPAAPFSIAPDRLAAIAAGGSITIHVGNESPAARCVERIRDDIRTLAHYLGPVPAPMVLQGVRAVWHHLTTLASLPCRPSDYDRFAGIPPLAARATSTFAREIAAWAAALQGDAGEIGSVIASDLEELRASLDDHPPFIPHLRDALSDSPQTLVVVRTRTAIRGALLGLGANPDGNQVGPLHFRAISHISREHVWPRAMVFGPIPPWDLPRLDSGLAHELDILTLGQDEAIRDRRSLAALHELRCRFGDALAQATAMSMLTGTAIETPDAIEEPRPQISIVAAREMPMNENPFDAFEALYVSKPLRSGEDDDCDLVAQETETGDWLAAVPAVLVETTGGSISLPIRRIVEVREGKKIIVCLAQNLIPGMFLLIGRRQGRLGLLEAVADRLQKRRPDIVASHLLIEALRMTVMQAFHASGLTKVRLFNKLTALGFQKTYPAVRLWVEENGPVAPRDLSDLRYLLTALEVEWPEQRIRDVFAGIQRHRIFRRSVGRALAEAARGSVVSASWSQVDEETGLSISDLRDAVIEAEVLRVVAYQEPMPVADLEHLIVSGAA